MSGLARGAVLFGVAGDVALRVRDKAAKFVGALVEGFERPRRGLWRTQPARHARRRRARSGRLCTGTPSLYRRSSAPRSAKKRGDALGVRGTPGCARRPRARRRPPPRRRQPPRSQATPSRTCREGPPRAGRRARASVGRRSGNGRGAALHEERPPLMPPPSGGSGGESAVSDKSRGRPCRLHIYLWRRAAKARICA